MNRLAIALAVLAVIGVAGCGTVSITPDRIDSIKSVSVAPEVKVAPKAFYFGPEQAWAAALGPGAAVAVALSSDAPGQIKAYLFRENIDVGAIVRTQFVKGLQGDPRFASKLGESGEARFELEVYLYGLITDSLFSSSFKPWLGIQARLIDSSGKIIWQDRDYVTHHNDAAPAVPYATYFDNPATFRAGFAAVADAITQCS